MTDVVHAIAFFPWESRKFLEPSDRRPMKVYITCPVSSSCDFITYLSPMSPTPLSWSSHCLRCIESWLCKNLYSKVVPVSTPSSSSFFFSRIACKKVCRRNIIAWLRIVAAPLSTARRETIEMQRSVCGSMYKGGRW